VFRKVLIANRGEIALRVLRACRELGVRSVAVYSQADRESLPVLLADEAVCIGPPPAERSYLNVPAIVSAALLLGADAIHPGYGFLAENSSFAHACEQCGLAFIGPSSELMDRLADKASQRAVLGQAGLPVLPGSPPLGTDRRQLLRFADRVGFPLLLKAAAGGGGRGLRVARDREELLKAFPIAQSEAQAGFGSPKVYLERYLERPRHVEVQVLGDSQGQVVALGNRECSLQLRHQKVAEEAPAPRLSSSVAREMSEAVVAAAGAIGYRGAGTFEFLVDSVGRYYFLELNKRIQVEHTVTEMVTGLDIVKLQLALAAGEHVPSALGRYRSRGHAIEARVVAEDPDRDFLPQGGPVGRCHLPGGPFIRVDSHIYSGYVMPTHYDSLLAKIIAWGRDRAEALGRLRHAVQETEIEGLATNLPFMERLLASHDVQRGDLDTGLVERLADSLSSPGAEALASPPGVPATVG
jgi:acetyl-CoA carboxylase biotin carboxylase subunit